MRSSWLPSGSAALAVAVLALAARPARAQGWHERGLWAAAVFQQPAFYGAGLQLGWRDDGRTRIQFAAAAGAEDGAGAAGRVEAVWHFLLDPYRRQGTGVYGGGGLALAIDHDGTVRPALEVVLGAESAPWSPRSTFIEAGFGRGVRVALGMRWRTHSR